MLRLLLAALVFLPAICWATPAEVLVKAQRAYQRGKYETTVKLLKPLLYPEIRLSKGEEVLQAHKLLGISYVFVKDNRAAEKEFLAILATDPNYRFDSFVDPVVAVEIFDSVKKRNADVLKRISERERKEEELRRQAAARLIDQKRRLDATKLPKQKIAYNRYWLNFLPFGVGQFQNGHSAKGYALLSLQAAAAASSMTLFSWRLAEGKVPSAQADRAQKMEIAQVVCGGVFFAAALYGIIDAMAYYQPETSMGTIAPDKAPSPADGAGDNNSTRRSTHRSTETDVGTSWILAPTAGLDGGGLTFSFTY